MKTAWIYTAYCPETLPKPSENTLIIGVDAGCDYLLQNLMIPDFAVGDFDSASPDILKKLTEKTEIRKSIPEKDKSDTELAIDLCQELGCTTIRDLCQPDLCS
jgi:thiamine pyrophosphokinase